MWRKFRKHKAGMISLFLLTLIMLFILFAEFTAPYGENEISEYIYAPPQIPRFIDEDGHFHLRPFVYGREAQFNLETGTIEWITDTSAKHHLAFFVKGAPYKFLGFTSDIHLFGVEGGKLFLLGTDDLGRDVFSRIIYGGRVSLIVAVATALMSLGLGTLAGLLSGYFGGIFDLIIQRVVELFLIVPNIPLGLALAAFLPPDMAPGLLMLAVAGVLTVTSWSSVARQVRGKTLAIRETSFVKAAISIGASTPRVLLKHVLPPIYPHLIVLATLTIPQVILAESGLSFLGFGIRPPMTSWGALLKNAQNFRVIALYPWLMAPGVFIILTVLALNFIGDGLRDAVDPYSN